MNVPMEPGQNPDDYFNQKRLLRIRAEKMREHISDRYVKDICVTGFTDNYKDVKMMMYRDPSFDVDQMQTTMRHMFLDEQSRNGTKERIAGRGSVMTAVTSEQDIICYWCKNRGHSKKDCPKFKSRTKPAGAAKWCSVHRTTTHRNEECYSQGATRPTKNASVSLACTKCRHCTSADSKEPTVDNTEPSHSDKPVINFAGSSDDFDGGFMYAARMPGRFTPSAKDATLLVDSGASESFLDDELIPDLKTRMREYKTPSHAASNSLATEEAMTGTSEGFSPPPPTDSRYDDVASSLWEKDVIGPDVFGGRQQGNDDTVPAGERCLDADASQASHAPPSRVVGAGTATGAWSAGETDAMPGQQEEDGKGTRQDAEWWDWADPWGQEAAWGAPAFGVGTGGTQPFHHDDAVPTPDALPEGDAHSPAQPPAGNEGASGWKVVSGQIEVGVQCTETSTLGDPDAVTVASRRKELEELAQALTKTRKELEDAREVENALRSALREQEEARASAAAAAAAAAEQAEVADALVKQRAEEAKENATAVGQLLVTLGLEQQNPKEQLAAAQSSSTLLTKELEDLRKVSRKAEHRANSSEAKLKVAPEDVAVLDEGLKQYMDGDSQQISSRPSPALWRRVSEAYLRPLLPSKLKTSSSEELEAVKLNRSLGRTLEKKPNLTIRGTVIPLKQDPRDQGMCSLDITFQRDSHGILGKSEGVSPDSGSGVVYTATTSASVWHRRLGHMNPRNMEVLRNKKGNGVE